MPRKITHSENQAYSPKQSDSTVHTISFMLFPWSPIEQFKWTKHTSITNVATTGLHTLSASPKACSRSDGVQRPGWCISTSPSGLQRGPVLSLVGSDALKHVSGGCPTNAQSDSSLGIALATPRRRCLLAPSRLGRLWPCEVGHCRASGQNPDLKPRQRVVPPVQGLHPDTAQLLTHLHQWPPGLFVRPDKCRPIPSRTHHRIGRIRRRCCQHTVHRPACISSHVSHK